MDKHKWGDLVIGRDKPWAEQWLPQKCWVAFGSSRTTPLRRHIIVFRDDWRRRHSALLVPNPIKICFINMSRSFSDFCWHESRSILNMSDISHVCRQMYKFTTIAIIIIFKGSNSLIYLSSFENKTNKFLP